MAQNPDFLKYWLNFDSKINILTGLVKFDSLLKI